MPRFTVGVPFFFIVQVRRQNPSNQSRPQLTKARAFANSVWERFGGLITFFAASCAMQYKCNAIISSVTRTPRAIFPSHLISRDFATCSRPPPVCVRYLFRSRLRSNTVAGSTPADTPTREDSLNANGSSPENRRSAFPSAESTRFRARKCASRLNRGRYLRERVGSAGS